MTTTEYNKCVDYYSDNIYRFVLKQIRDDDAAQDIVQDTFLRVWKRVNDVDFNTAKSYLFKTANNLIVDRFRSKKNVIDIDDISEFGTYTGGYSDVMEQLEFALERLSQVQKSVLMLRDYEGYSYQEIGEIVNLNQSQVKVYLFRARKKMKDYLIKIGVEL